MFRVLTSVLIGCTMLIAAAPTHAVPCVTPDACGDPGDIIVVQPPDIKPESTCGPVTEGYWVCTPPWVSAWKDTNGCHGIQRTQDEWEAHGCQGDWGDGSADEQVA